MKSFKAKVIAACAGAVVVLHALSAFDKENVVAQIADKAITLIDQFVRILLAVS